MTENKAKKALRKVTINLIPEEFSGKPIPNDAILTIDISDKLEDGKYYCLESIKVENDAITNTIGYVSFDDYSNFKKSVENILDAIVVNNKQRESVQIMVNQAFWNQTKHNTII